MEDSTNNNDEILEVSGDMISVKESRFSGALWYEKIQETEVTVAGIGGIGSYVCYLLSRMNLKMIKMFDPDIVEAVNLSGQMYRSVDIGFNKVSAMANIMNDFSMYKNYIAMPTYFNSSSNAEDIIICGFDNMEARRLAFEMWKGHVNSLEGEAKSNCLFIDGRLDAEMLQIFSIKGDDERAMEDYYTNHLFTDAQADETVCSYKQTTYMANMIGSLITNIFVNFIANKCNPAIEHDVPFYTEYDSSMMFFKAVN